MATTLPPKQLVPSFQWVKIRNLEPIRNYNSAYAFGDTCSIDTPGTVELLAQDRDRVLVRYHSDRTAAGALCPDGAIFFLDAAKYAEMTKQAKQQEEAIQAERDLVANLLVHAK